MTWLRVRLTEEQQQSRQRGTIRSSQPPIREKMLVLWLLHNGVTRRTRPRSSESVGPPSRGTWPTFREGGLEACGGGTSNRPESEMAAYRDLIRESFEKQPVRTVAEACEPRLFN